ncbi:hypothetical protein COV06_01280 [Candidatus Uhrbacteria bacterium CG10_big_fil_rev_8_21_14_0_10_50_16]|uniref:UDP-N-acetyl-alpha-D-muramoyl-L-alanyl-L-glutamate epimerase n=1 Tax=Candidatus Uhrbacteria bacterium CG10_big_fil_rev_8_21_14_0_10_50_16 TaxID=1975039 RepID=A0A2H0RPV3_9BACT|nr:MAG: hypothetical protein COV06_01280 [Candidatus Uhrbacteria bacterium CG10_big_fil_rev_8_21_14_0_10_50_16]
MQTFSNKTFTFVSYAFETTTGVITLLYDLNGDTYKERITVPMSDINMDCVPQEDLDRALFSLHLMVGIGYWKTYCPKNIVIQSGQLTRTQAHFWNTVYTNGLGELYYKNDIDFRDQVHFPYNKDLEALVPQGSNERKEHVLVPFGGGKDSVVTAELMRKLGFTVTLFSIQDAAPIQDAARVFDAPHVIVDRALDPNIVDPTSAVRTDPQAFNGHVPISAIWSMITVVTAILHGATDIVYSWERSASEGNLEYLGMEINHQWSKSLAFERSLQAYVDTFITKRTRIYSLVRPLSEFHIVQLFTRYPQYFDSFSSCNRNYTQEAIANHAPTFWCNQCPKCAFIFSQLNAFLPHTQVVNIFGEDMFANDNLLDLYRELLGIQGNKPFECVGEAKEVVAAMELAYRRADANDAPVMQLYAGEVRDTVEDHDAVIQDLLTPSTDHAVPSDIVARVDYAA